MLQIVLLLLLTGNAPTFEAKTLDDRSVEGSLVELTADHLVLETADGNVSLETGKLLELTAKPKPAAVNSSADISVELIDGSILTAGHYTVQAAQARVVLLDGETIEIPTRSIRLVRLQALPERSGEEWSQIISKKTDADLLLVRKGDSLDYHEGVLDDVTAGVVQFHLDGETLPVKRVKVMGMVYHHARGGGLPGAVARVNDVFGSQWQAQNITINGKVRWTTPAGVSRSLARESVGHIDFSAGKIAYLSDLTPESAAWTPFFGTEKPLPALEKYYSPKRDRNFESGPLRLDGVEYPKGLAIHSRTEMVYRLPDSFHRLKAVAGIDDSVRPQGDVKLLIRGDAKALLEIAITGNDAPALIDLDITGVRRLSILVDFSEQADIGGHLDLGNARLSK
jgi:hypothetical protein